MEDEIDALFRVPLGEFTPARNALAARLKKAGENAMADEVKALPKPSVAAWAVNQLYWQHRDAFDRMIGAGDRYRQTQSREHLDARRNAQAELARIAAAVLHEAGSSGARDMLRRVTGTLDALATYGSLADAPRAGRLTAELTPPGFDLLAGLLPRSRGTPTRSAGDQRAPKPADHKDARAAAARRDAERRQRLAAEAKAALREGERAVRAARTQAERTAAALATAAKRAKESERRRVSADKRLAKVVVEAKAAHGREKEAEANARQAALAVEHAERELELARRKLDEL